MANYTEAGREAIALAPTNVVHLFTLQIKHPSLEDDIYIVNDRKAHEFTLETGEKRLFLACGFDMRLPSAGDSGLQAMDIAIDDTNNMVSDFVNTVKDSNTAVQILFRPYVSTDLTKPIMNPPLLLFLSDIVIDNTVVNAKASFMDVINKRFPSDIYTRSRFKGLANL